MTLSSNCQALPLNYTCCSQFCFAFAFNDSSPPLPVFQIPGYLVCWNCSRSLLYCTTCSKSDRKRAREPVAAGKSSGEESARSDNGVSGSGGGEIGGAKLGADASDPGSVTRKRARQDAVPTVPVAVKTENELDSSSNTPARSAGFTASVPAAVKAEATRKSAATHAANSSSESQSKVAAETGVNVST